MKLVDVVTIAGCLSIFNACGTESNVQIQEAASIQNLKDQIEAKPSLAKKVDQEGFFEVEETLQALSESRTVCE